ncbi:MAG: MerR family transcriptional regulator [Saprospiraceae bacterium]|nr:MerR family transcriptional regulator [Saprospiraceae bacterium]
MDLKDTRYADKLYFTIGEVSDILQIPASMIRYWENEFDVLKPHKNSKGDRRYTKSDIGKLQNIYHLVKEKGFTLDGAKKELAKNLVEGEQNDLYSKLLELKKRLISIKDKL